jgi:hypothetical protein
MNQKFEPTLNPYHYFLVDYKNARECIQVTSKVCVWCGRKPCSYFQHEAEIFAAAKRSGGILLQLNMGTNRAAKRAAYLAYDMAVFGPLGNRKKNHPIPFCVEARIKMLWPSIIV